MKTKAKTLGEQVRDMNKKNPNSDKIPLVCHNCGYYWHYGGKLSRATCPDCAAKVKVAEQRQDRIL